MTETLRKCSTDLRLSNIEVEQAGFLTYEHEGTPADFVYTRNALHHLPDFWKALALTRIAAMLKPSGVLRLRDLVFSVRRANSQPSSIDGLTQPLKKKPSAGHAQSSNST
jgi:hypothetical protein